MINFRQKQFEVKDLMQQAIAQLSSVGIKPTIISADQADSESKKSSRSLVLEEFIQNDHGFYQITVRDAKYYSWTRKMLGESFRMNILETDPTKRTVTAETEHLGIALDIIEILGSKYNLSVVRNGKI